MTLDNWVNTAVMLSSFGMGAKIFIEWMDGGQTKRLFISAFGILLAVTGLADTIRHADEFGMRLFLNVFLGLVAMLLSLKLFREFDEAEPEDRKAFAGIGLAILLFYVCVNIFA